MDTVRSLRHRIQHLPPVLRLIRTALLFAAAAICLVYAVISAEAAGARGPFVVCSTLFALLAVTGLTIIADGRGIDTD
jgi:hypothetical protein